MSGSSLAIRRRWSGPLRVPAVAVGTALLLGVGATAAFADVAAVSGSAVALQGAVTAPVGVTVGPVSAVTLPAGGQAPPGTSASVLSVAVPPGADSVVRSGTLTGHTQGQPDPNGQVTSDAGVENLSVGPVLAPVLSAAVLSSNCTADASGATGSSRVVGLVAGGNTIIPDGTPNQVVPLGPLGSITINEQTPSDGGHSITVNALHIRLTSALVTGDIIVAQSRCSALPSNQVPVGAIGGLVLAGLVGAGLVGTVVVHGRRRARSAASI
jgi:hypothetical protein